MPPHKRETCRQFSLSLSSLRERGNSASKSRWLDALSVSFRLLNSTAALPDGFSTGGVNDGEQAIAYLNGLGTYADRAKSPMPGAVLLDLNMPKKSGFEVLAWARTQPVLKRVPFVILTASMRLEDVERAFDLGASSFLV